MTITPELNQLIYSILAFLILVFVLGRFAYPPILDMLKKREETIRTSIDEAEKTRAEAARLLDEYKAQIAQARKEAQDMIEQGKKVGENVRTEITTKANEEARQIIERAQSEIEREKERALSDLQAKVADLTILATSKVIQKSLDEKSQRKLVEDAIAEVSGVGKA